MLSQNKNYLNNNIYTLNLISKKKWINYLVEKNKNNTLNINKINFSFCFYKGKRKMHTLPFAFAKKSANTKTNENIMQNSKKKNLYKYTQNKNFSSINKFLFCINQEKKKKFILNIINTVPKWISCVILNKNEITIYIYAEFISFFFFYIKNNVSNKFKMLVDVTAVDYPSRVSRFEVVYNLLSINYNARIRVKVCLNEINACTSISSLYSSANWWEREVYDMFGIFFSNHPDLRRILTDYGFNGHPLRKDFPLSGFVEVRYDDSEKRVIYEPLEISQEFRYFDFGSPWEQIEKN